MKDCMKKLIFLFLLISVLLLGFGTTSTAVSFGPVEHEIDLSALEYFSLFNEYSGSKAIPYNPLRDCVIKNDCKLVKYLNVTLSKPILTMTLIEIPILPHNEKLTISKHLNLYSIILLLPSPPPKS